MINHPNCGSFLTMFRLFLITTIQAFISLLSFGAEPSKCDSYLALNNSLKPNWTNTSEGLVPILDSWDPVNFTDPRDHNPNSYRYIVKMPGRVGRWSRLTEDNIRAFIEHVESKVRMSASVISDSARKVYGGDYQQQSKWGVLLEVDPITISHFSGGCRDDLDKSDHDSAGERALV